MDCKKIGNLISKLRKERGLTQKNVADALNISNKTVSKWECGMGCPDLSLWAELSEILGVDMKKMLEGELFPNRPDSGNIKKVNFYVCPVCNNVLMSTGPAVISCCGRKLPFLIPKEIPEHQFRVERMDLDFFISFQHEMKKEHYITFVACVTSDKVLVNRLYPEQSPEVRIPEMTGDCNIYAYCSEHGLWMQSV